MGREMAPGWLQGSVEASGSLPLDILKWTEFKNIGLAKC
jgi:hypothetical protein